MAWRNDVWISARAARSWLGSSPSNNSESIFWTTFCRRERIRGSPLLPSQRSRNSAPMTANASNEEFTPCNLVINESKLIRVPRFSHQSGVCATVQHNVPPSWNRGPDIFYRRKRRQQRGIGLQSVP